jgi:hypothetical protein
MPESNPTTEIWKPVTGFEGLYEVSNFGRVRRISYPLKPSTHTFGYKRVTLWKNKKRFDRYIHDLVALEFIGPKPKPKYVGHGDDDPSNNRVENLSYVTPLENNHQAINRGRWIHKWSGRHKISNQDVRVIRMLSQAGYNQKQIACWFATPRNNICRILNRTRRSHIDYYSD